MSFRRVVSAEELWEGEMVGVVLDGVKVLLLNVEGAVYAYEDRCAHKGVPLSTGGLEGRTLRCAVHGWEYDACSGRGLNPCGVRLRPLAVQVEHGEIRVDIDHEPRD
jgi:toluene monooxygenase system ferredoxin subunit